jgi:hypothetical protein
MSVIPAVATFALGTLYTPFFYVSCGFSAIMLTCNFVGIKNNQFEFRDFIKAPEDRQLQFKYDYLDFMAKGKYYLQNSNVLTDSMQLYRNKLETLVYTFEEWGYSNNEVFKSFKEELDIINDFEKNYTQIAKTIWNSKRKPFPLWFGNTPGHLKSSLYAESQHHYRNVTQNTENSPNKFADLIINTMSKFRNSLTKNKEQKKERRNQRDGLDFSGYDGWM